MLRLQPCCEKQRGLKRVGRRVDGSPEPVVVLGTPVYKRARGDEDEQNPPSPAHRRVCGATSAAGPPARQRGERLQARGARRAVLLQEQAPAATSTPPRLRP